MTTYSRGDVVLVKFVFADEKGVKQRPGLLVSSGRYHRSRREAILAAITSQVGRSLVGDHRITQWTEAGLPLPSTVTGIIRTIKQDMIIRKLGVLPAEEMASVEAQLRVSLALSIDRDATA
jgi:mRNA-degrading endonuclease toxin of MazEF toxin-antitoxin module